MQISIDRGGIPQKAIDGSSSSFFNNFTCSLTKPEISPWWYVNLLEPYMVQLVRLDFGKSCCGPNNTATVVVRVGNNRPDLGTNPICNRFTGYLKEGQPLFLPCNPPMPGAFVSVHLETVLPTSLSMCEAFVYTDQALPIERCPIFRDQPPGSTATYNGKCYIFYNQQPKSFRGALEFCRSRGGTLVDESNPALQGFISWELWRRHRGDIRSQYWIGTVRDTNDKSNWKWVNGDDVTISFWSSPLSGKEDCARYDGSKGWLWSEINCNMNLSFICQHQPKACGRPEQPPNSTMIIKNANVGANIEYICDEGHILIGPSVRKCLDTGFYNEFPPICKYIQCGYPAEIVNGDYSLVNNSIDYLSNAIYKCNEGYRMVGESLLMCDFDEKWNGPPPKCEIIECEEPPAIANGYYKKINNSTIYGSIIQYLCKMDYKLIGSDKLVCSDNGQYDQQPPKCQEVVTTTIAKPKYTTVIRTKAPKPTTTVSTTISTTIKHQVENTPTQPTDPPALHPIDNEVDANSINSRYDNGPNINIPRIVDSNRSPAYGARFNMGVMIALGVIGSFLFLAAIVTTLVFLLRRRNGAKHFRHRTSPDCRTVDSFDSSSSESRNGGLSRFYRQAWENLHESASSKAGLKAKSNFNLNNNHQPLKRKETLDEPYRNSERHRDGSELIVSDSKNFTNGKINPTEKKRHHHHHHHHDLNSKNRNWRDSSHIHKRY